MLSTFHGLEVAKRGMFTQQAALYVTAHNIANANTPGYSRQRVNFVETEPFPPASMNRPQIPGQMGTGVEAGSIQRIRDSFLDYQYRNEASKLGYWSARSEAIAKMEDIMNEPSEFGLSKAMTQFWESLQDLSANPENEGARAVVRQRGIAVAESFNYLYTSLSQIRDDLGQEIKTGLLEVNSILKQISELNDQIKAVEPNGYLPNDLYDKRDALVDELSKYFQVKVETVPSGGNALDIAEGIYEISLVNQDGSTIKIVTKDGYSKLSVDPPVDPVNDPTNPDGYVSKIQIEDALGNITTIRDSEFGNLASGRIKSLIESYGYGSDPNNVKGYYPEMLADLDKMAYSFATMFNAQHREGYDLNNSNGVDFFEMNVSDNTTGKGAAASIKVSDVIMSDLGKIAASSNSGESGNGNNALYLSMIKDVQITNGSAALPSGSGTTVSVPITSGTVQTFYQGLVGKIGVDGQQAERMKTNAETLATSVDNKRQSVSSVSLDEEMTNMIKFQHAYNAAARIITAIDEMLDKIINNMGIAGR
ncbi:flagellar hook-associated protein FlgK [Parageobacillus thermoglucosidasius]|uniref:flagellar hook-associated protein FlgK n=1 Tax=Parageobacillus thermoglucosidasius TaxID=1426 RepID=UPI002E201991|nr:flagellar hook-associated protein FlgK [Parageobacillus thermoglucosidasius]MED4905511.1 flagellar hook-associated protein FlgK [Parageobacillus thermoglucosidasius]MED4913910.1 flagellar hook-associated protein FlgK [Parageobacillus thermoglucosidasius]MED4943889.1 flagellar hook-associated protein FlgK [Parageobacillus thermoglucosidasius]MED4983593.1 flagellar hook-associated protein FlgK [Parageobacillus thermoglucosidasius]